MELADINIMSKEQIRELGEIIVELTYTKLKSEEKSKSKEKEKEEFYTPQTIVKFYKDLDSDHGVRRVRKLIKTGKLGQINAFNKPVVSRAQMDKFYFLNKKD